MIINFRVRRVENPNLNIYHKTIVEKLQHVLKSINNGNKRSDYHCSRKAVACQVYEYESGDLAADLITDACRREKIQKNQVTLHSDNGSPMKSATMLAKLQDLGVMPSFSRPSISNDNPYSESLFRTLKYRPEYPDKPFKNLFEARECK